MDGQTKSIFSRPLTQMGHNIFTTSCEEYNTMHRVIPNSRCASENLFALICNLEHSDTRQKQNADKETDHDEDSNSRAGRWTAHDEAQLRRDRQRFHKKDFDNIPNNARGKSSIPSNSNKVKCLDEC